MKVAQYEVLGSVRKNDPSRTGRSTAGYVHQVACEKSVAKDSIVPGGTDISFCIIPSTSYWATFIGSLPLFALLPSDFADLSAKFHRKLGLRRTSRDYCLRRTSLRLMFARICGCGTAGANAR